MKKVVFMVLLVSCICSLFFVATVTHAEEFQAAIVKKIDGTKFICSRDDRDDVRILGVKTGCPGSTYTINITLFKPVVQTTEGSLDAAYSVVVKAEYSGLHVEDKWGGPCVQNGSEKTNVSGSITVTIKRSDPFAQMELTFGEVTNNPPKYTSETVRNAVLKAFGFKEVPNTCGIEPK